jgi:hypothetical protein
MRDWKDRTGKNEPPASLGSIISNALSTKFKDPDHAWQLFKLYDVSYKINDRDANLDITAAINDTEKYPQAVDEDYRALLENRMNYNKDNALKNPLPPIEGEEVSLGSSIDLAIHVAKRMEVNARFGAAFLEGMKNAAEEKFGPQEVPLDFDELSTSSEDLASISKNLRLLRGALNKLSDTESELSQQDRLSSLKVLSQANEIIVQASKKFKMAFALETTIGATPNAIRAEARTMAHIAALSELAGMLAPAIEKAQGELQR